MPSGQALLEQQEGMHHKQLQLFLNGRSLCPAATLPRQPYTHPGSCLFPLGLQRFKEYITSVLSLRHCHFVFIKSSPAASEGESRKKISASLKKKSERKENKWLHPKQSPLLYWLHLAAKVCLFLHPLPSLVSTACPRLCELTLHRKDVTCDAQDYYVFIFWNVFPVQPAKGNRLPQWGCELEG